MNKTIQKLHLKASRLHYWVKYGYSRIQCENDLCRVFSFDNPRNETGAVLVDAMWDNPNYWLRWKLFQSALNVSPDACIALLGKWTSGRCDFTLKRFGIKRYLNHQDIGLSPEVNLSIERIVSRLETGAQILGNELPFSYHGDFIYDLILKVLRKPTLLDASRSELAPHYRETVRGIFEAEEILNRMKPSLVVLSHPFGVIDGPLLWLATQKHIPVVMLLGGYGRNSFVKFDANHQQWDWMDAPKGVELNTISASEGRLFSAIGEEYLLKRKSGKGTDIGAKYAYRNKNGLLSGCVDLKNLFDNPHKKLVAVFASNWFDFPHGTGMKNFEDFYVWIKTTLDVAIKHDHCNWFFRGHPCDAWYGGITLRSLFEKYDFPNHVKICSEDIATAIVLEESDAFITIQGTVGIEASSIRKPVLSADASWYSDCGFVKFAASREEYLETLKTEWWKDVDLEKAAERAKVFAGIYFGLPKWQKEFIQEDDSVQWDIYKRMPAMLDRAKDEIEIEKECIRRWWASDHRFFHTWKMLNCYEGLPLKKD